jgi:hypothetical protein
MADKISLEQALTQAAGGTVPDPTPTPAPQPQPESTPVPVAEPEVVEEGEEKPPVVKAETSTKEGTKPAQKVEAKPVEDDKKPNPMKEVREKYSTEKNAREKIETTVTRFTNGEYTFKLKDFNVDGKLDYDALSKAMDEADTKVKAEQRGITPEIQAEIERIEKDKIELNKQKLQVSMDRALTNLQQNMNVKGAEINNFFKDAMALRKNPYQWLAQGGDLQDLYILVYRDKLLKQEIDNAIGQAKSKWEEELQRKTKVPVANPAKPTQTTATKNTNGPSLQELLSQAAGKK